MSCPIQAAHEQGRKQRAATPPTKQGEARINNFATAATAAAAAAAPIKPTEERRRADTHRQTVKRSLLLLSYTGTKERWMTMLPPKSCDITVKSWMVVDVVLS
ncbi:hypothetical protein ABVT39_014607 [Epinephelus coioides]